MGRTRRLPAEPFATEVLKLNDDGSGHALVEDRPLRVWGALGGERVQARYLFGRKFRGQAQAVEVEQASSLRVEPRCPSFGTCSACVLQHLEPEAQLQHKQEYLLRQLDEQGGIEPQHLLEPLSADHWHYRRKARLSVRDVPAKGRVLVGFRERDGRFVTDMTECHTLDQRLAGALPALSDCLGQLEARAKIPQIEAACGDKGVALVIRHLEPLSASDLKRLEDFEQSSGLAVWLQSRGPDTAMPLTRNHPALSYKLPDYGLNYDFKPLDFIQINAGLNQKMVALALDLLELSQEHSVLDLFCGLGNFTLPVAQRSRQVIGFEGDEGLVQRAKANARRNAVTNVDFQRADLYSDHIDECWPVQPVDRILLDPPRSGAGVLLSKIGQSAAPRIVYVSCNPKTLAEDASKLIHEYKYRLINAGVIDMFPQTPHSEAIAVFEKS